MPVIEIASKSHPYRVASCPDPAAALREAAADPAAFFIVDAEALRLFPEWFAPVVASGRAVPVAASEEAKSYLAVEPVFCRLLELGIRRTGRLIVIGGGVLQDIGCFIASTLFRGVRWTFFPTTLLAQCDSCIGGKSSLNIGSYKNQLGTFYAPHEILLSTRFLATLPPDQIVSGLGEAIKLHWIEGAEAVARLHGWLADPARFEENLEQIIWSSLRIKHRFIEEDEFDRGIRNLLNYGHTFAHAFESATAYAVPHGIAVTAGTACAVIFSERRGLLPAGEWHRLRAWLRPYYGKFVPVLRAASRAKIVTAMTHDKKNTGTGITFILTAGPGRMEKTPLPREEVEAALDYALEVL